MSHYHDTEIGLYLSVVIPPLNSLNCSLKFTTKDSYLLYYLITLVSRMCHRLIVKECPDNRCKVSENSILINS